MKFKLMLVALPIIAIATIFTFCSKEPVIETVNQVADPNAVATDRGPCSEIRFEADGLTSICGTTNGTGICTLCNTTQGVGFATFGPNNPHIFGSTMLNGVASLRNINGSDGGTTVRAFADGVEVAKYQLLSGQCVNVKVVSNADENNTNCATVIFF